VADVYTVLGMTPSSSFRLHLSRMREASEITSRDASEQILALIRVGYTVLTYPRVPSLPPPASFRLSIRRCHRRHFSPRHPWPLFLYVRDVRIFTSPLPAPCIFTSAGNLTFPVRLLTTRFIAPMYRSFINHPSAKIRAFVRDTLVKDNVQK